MNASDGWRSPVAPATLPITNTAVYALFFGTLLVPFMPNAWRARLFVDEVTYLSHGNAAVRMARHGDLLSRQWVSNDWDAYGWQSPMMAKWLMGISLHLFGYGDLVFKTVSSEGAPITPEVLHAARLPGALLAWGTCVLLFLIGQRISPSVGVIAAVLAATNVLFVTHAAMAMLEAAMAFFATLTMLLRFDRHFVLLYLTTPVLVASGTRTVALVAASAVGSLWRFLVDRPLWPRTEQPDVSGDGNRPDRSRLV